MVRERRLRRSDLSNCGVRRGVMSAAVSPSHGTSASDDKAMNDMMI